MLKAVLNCIWSINRKYDALEHTNPGLRFALTMLCGLPLIALSAERSPWFFAVALPLIVMRLVWHDKNKASNRLPRGEAA